VVTEEQQAICKLYGVAPFEAPRGLKVGLALGTNRDPIHGLRHPPEGDTTGWYIWRGEWSDTEDFFAPLHASHLEARLPEVVPYLALPPGWRFLLAPGHADVWQDPELLNI
jgi:hypothetical protein